MDKVDKSRERILLLLVGWHQICIKFSNKITLDLFLCDKNNLLWWPFDNQQGPCSELVFQEGVIDFKIAATILTTKHLEIRAFQRGTTQPYPLTLFQLGVGT